jgi:hypothetical protein
LIVPDFGTRWSVELHSPARVSLGGENSRDRRKVRGIQREKKERKRKKRTREEKAKISL